MYVLCTTTSYYVVVKKKAKWYIVHIIWRHTHIHSQIHPWDQPCSQQQLQQHPVWWWWCELTDHRICMHAPLVSPSLSLRWSWDKVRATDGGKDVPIVCSNIRILTDESICPLSPLPNPPQAQIRDGRGRGWKRPERGPREDHPDKMLITQNFSIDNLFKRQNKYVW